MKHYIISAAILMSLTPFAFAGGSHSGGHNQNENVENQAGGHGHGNDDGHHGAMAIGRPGANSDVSRTINVVMKETDEGHMIFEPHNIEVEKGDTVRFVIENAGELEHEFVLDNHDGVMEHKALMEKFPEMEHDDPNSVRLEPGHEGNVIWTFTNSGSFEFACLIPGHYDAGMKGELSVVTRVSEN